jgi:hypothetical protein
MNPQDRELSVIFARLDVLERQNRRFKRAGATIVLLAVSATLLMGQARTTKVLEANEFVLKDASGKVRARLGIGVTGLQLPSHAPSDLASLQLYDSAAKPMARLMAATDDGGLTLGPSSAGMPAIVMDVNQKSALQTLNAGAAATRRIMYLGADPTRTSIILKNANDVWTAP